MAVEAPVFRSGHFAACLSAAVLMAASCGATVADEVPVVPARSDLAAWLEPFRGSVVFSAQRIAFDDAVFNDVTVPLELEQNRAKFDTTRLITSAGVIDVSAALDYRTRALNLKIASEKLDLRNTQDDNERQRQVFDDGELIPGWLARVRGRVELEIGELLLTDFSIQDLNAPLLFTSDGFDGSVTGSLGDGSARLNLAHRYNDRATRLNGRGDNIPLAEISSRKYVKHAPTTFKIDLGGAGNTARALASSLNGDVYIEIGTGTVELSELGKLSQNIFALTMRSILPLPLRAGESILECAAVNLTFNNGIANTEHGIMLRTERLAIMGGGTVDLTDESLDLRLQPHVRKGLEKKIRSSVKSLHVHGPLHAPGINATVGGLIDQGIVLSSSLANFGLSKLGASFLDWGTSPDIACEQAVTM